MASFNAFPTWNAMGLLHRSSFSLASFRTLFWSYIQTYEFHKTMVSLLYGSIYF